MALWHLEGSLDETKTVRKILVNDFPFVIGRSKALDMVILRNGISREHAEIFMRSGRLYIRDLGSTNGTFVNNQRISSDTLLTHNTIIHFSEVEFKLVDIEFKEPIDEQMTVVVNAAKVVGLKKDAVKTSPVAAHKEKSQKDSQADEEPAEETSQSSTSAQARKQHSRHLANEKIFIHEGMDSSNRRMHPRREARWPAIINLKTNKNTAPVQCVTKDLSETGLSLNSSVSLPTQSLVSIEIQTFYKGRNRDFSVIGVIKHSSLAANGFIFGIQIKQCSDVCKEFMKKYSNHQI